MALIFTGSSDSSSFQRSSRIIAPVVGWLCPNMTEDGVREVVTVVRKGAHVTEYAVLACLVWRLRRKPRHHDTRPWRWRDAGIALLVAVIYASGDEIHQLFVPGREGCVRDVLIDTSGAVAGLLCLWAIGRWLKKW
jgi:VanZ family protein